LRTALPVPADAQADLRRRILRAFVGLGLLESFDAKDMPVGVPLGNAVPTQHEPPKRSAAHYLWVRLDKSQGTIVNNCHSYSLPILVWF
jgi:hypothetical protein